MSRPFFTEKMVRAMIVHFLLTSGEGNYSEIWLMFESLKVQLEQFDAALSWLQEKGTIEEVKWCEFVLNQTVRGFFE